MPLLPRSRGQALLSVRAPAKINFSLRVTARRPDGYHEVRTILQSLALHDTLRLRPVRGPLAIECDDPACPTDRTNLVWQAAARVWRAAGRRGRPQGVLVGIEKRIPLQAGLGGGSSDAAAAIRGLNAFWRVDLPEQVQADVARHLGADVPYFLRGGTALGLGRGDLLFPLADVPSMWIVLVIPPFGVSTKDAYAWWDDAPRQPARSRRTEMGFRDPHWFRAPLSELTNDLEGPVVARHPPVGRAIRSLLRAGASYAAMSGSGSAVFGVFTSRSTAIAGGVAAAIWGRPLLTRTVGRRAYQRQAPPSTAGAAPVRRP